MDYSLRCNSLKCRKQLNDEAVVTTCSHIFCIPCAQTLGLASAESGGRHCPACETPLNNPDDAVVTQLNPTEDYKTSVLSGLTPGVIMECAGRGLSFYSYQATQEIVYQEYLAKSLTDKYSALSGQMDKIIHDANSEIVGLREKLAAVNLQQKQLEDKNCMMEQHYKEKSRSAAKTQKLYEKLKSKMMAGDLGGAAEIDAENILHNTHGQYGDEFRRPEAPQQAHVRTGSGHSAVHRNNGGAFNGYQQGNRGSGMQSSHSFAIPATPYRQRLTALNPGNSVMGSMIGGGGINQLGGDHSRHGTPAIRQPLGSIDPNVQGRNGGGGYGMSAGMKMGRQQSGPFGINGGQGQAGRVHGYGGLGMR